MTSFEIDICISIRDISILNSASILKADICIQNEYLQ